MKKLNPILEKKAVDLYAHTPNIKHSEVAKQLEISDKTLLKLRKDGKCPYALPINKKALNLWVFFIYRQSILSLHI